MSKIFEKVVLHKLFSHPQENSLSNPFQSAYRAGHSTETVLSRIINYILSTSGQWQYFCSLFAGSFWSFWDYWPPNSPLPPEVCFWHSVYCTPMVSVIPLRHQSISVNNLSSSPSQLMYGMPQGSVLGPILFGEVMLNVLRCQLTY